ncbi:hypothetical protein D3C78_1269280 [compost metagenome]
MPRKLFLGNPAGGGAQVEDRAITYRKNHPNWIHLDHASKHGRGVGHKAANGNVRDTYPPLDRRGNFCVAEVQPGLADLHIGRTKTGGCGIACGLALLENRLGNAASGE